MRSFLVILGLVALILVILGFIGYTIVTNNIIREQEREIAELRTQLKRQHYKKAIPLGQGSKKPKFGDF